MEDKEIFKKAMDKSIKGGWDLRYPPTISNRLMNYKRYYRYIFDLGFARGLWGEKYVAGCVLTIATKDGGEQDFNRKFKSYEFNIMQMALEEEPLKYIEKFL